MTHIIIGSNERNHEEALNKMLDEVVAWSNALKTVRG
jgi:hypothetical protein